MKEEIKRGLSKYVTGSKSYGVVCTTKRGGKFKISLTKFLMIIQKQDEM